MIVEAIGATDIGQKRSNNEDSFFIDNMRGVFVVCDGMGGLANGDVASQTAIEGLVQHLKATEEQWQGWLQAAQVEPLQHFVQDIINTICGQIYQKAHDQSDHSRMGTTLTALLISGSKGAMIHVGDSRLYLCRGGTEHQLSHDHTLLEELINRGVLKRAESKNHPHGHILTKSIGTHPSVLPDMLLFDVVPGDIFVLCSDGLSGYIEERGELLDQLNQLEPEDQATGLVTLANQRGGHDNITTIVVSAAAPIDLSDTIEDKGASTWGHTFHQMFLQLDQSFLCKGLQMPEVMRLLNICQHVTIPEVGVDIIKEGEASDGFYILLGGECEITQEGRFARTLKKSHHFGDTALFDEQEALETVRTKAPTSLLMIKRSDFATFTRRRPKLGQKLMRNTSRELSRRWRLLKTTVADVTRE